MNRRCAVSALFLLTLSPCVWSDQLVLSPLDDAQVDRTAYLQPYILTNPPPNNRLYMYRLLNTTGEFHNAFLEYSLASLPANATVTGVSFTYAVSMTAFSNGQYSRFNIDLFDGGDGQTTIADLGENVFSVAQTQNLTDTNTNFTTPFSDISPMNNRDVNFPSGYLGLRLFPSLEAFQAAIWPADQSLHQVPVLTVDFVAAPEPASLLLLTLGSALLLRADRRSRSR